ncbi:hypothetical protein [Vibrio brasiliensis]|uniref:hypothetical protein n=1 Tax=Vibrio brasiliensis TaxID=170652 RepID=UPI001EFD80E3|nr:hypothetical protein [Vibrio brasiliensis]MCG9727154.1 hypothetical protein [Vibrio brasiliensis]
MLKVSTNKAIAGYAPCSECNTLAAVHFPNGGRRANTPYLSCGGCNKTMDVNAEQEQIAANKWTENPALYDAKVNGLVEELQTSLLEDSEPVEGEVLEATPPNKEAVNIPGQESVTIDNDTQQVVDEEAEAKKPQERGGVIWLVVLLAVLLLVSVGGYCLVKRSKRKAVEAQAKQEVKADE